MQHRLDLNVIANARKYGSEWDKNDGLDISSGKYSSTQHYGFMRFGEISIPSYAIIVSAILRFYVNTKQSGSGYTHYAYPVQDNGTLWTESAPNGAAAKVINGLDGQPARGSVYLNTTPVWYNCNVAKIVEAWRDGLADPTRGIVLTCSVNESYGRIYGRQRANAPTLTIIYDVPGSVPEPESSMVELTGTLNTNIQVNEAGAQHTIAYMLNGEFLMRDGAPCQYALADEILSHAFTLDAAFGALFPNDPTATLTVEVTTTVNGEPRGTVGVDVLVTMPQSALPDGTCIPSMLSQIIPGVEAYIQGKSGVSFAITATAKYGASIVTRKLAFEGIVHESFPAMVPNLANSGDRPYALTITDSRGLVGVINGSIYVHELKPPVISAFACARGIAVGEADDDAENVIFALAASVSPINVDGAKNTLQYIIKSRPVNTAEWENNDPVYAPTGVAAIIHEDMIRRGGVLAVFTAYQGYEYRVEVTDRFETSAQHYTIPTNTRQMVLSRDGRSMSFGGSIVPGHIAFYHPLEGLPSYSAERVYTGERWLNGRKIYRKTFIFGSMAASGSLDIPIGEEAIEEVVSLRGAVGTSGGTNLELLPFTHHTTLTYQKGLTVSSLASNPFIAIRTGSGATAPVGGYVVIEYVPIDPATQWSKPYMTVASESGCVVSASSSDSASYVALKGFSLSPTEYWVSTLLDPDRWIQMQMPGGRTNIVLYICNHNTAATYPGVQAGTFYGSNDGSTWDEIGTFSERPDRLNFGLTAHHLKNQTPYSYIRIKITSPAANVEKCRIGRISVFGDIA